MRMPTLVSAWLPALVVAGCAITPTPFQRAASDAAGSLSVAATAIRYVHQGRTTTAYAISTLATVDEQLGPMPGQLRRAAGDATPSQRQILATAVEVALQAVRQPCLTENCDWRRQVESLDAAMRALLEVRPE